MSTSRPARPRVLLVEDCATDAELLALVFDDAGLPIDWACVGTERALRTALAEGPVDIVISDYNLPGFDGMHALRIVRELAPSVPFVFCCGESDSVFEHTAQESGALACVLKREMWKVPETVRELLDR